VWWLLVVAAAAKTLGLIQPEQVLALDGETTLPLNQALVTLW
jgi:hypothetical protein